MRISLYAANSLSHAVNLEIHRAKMLAFTQYACQTDIDYIIFRQQHDWAVTICVCVRVNDNAIISVYFGWFVYWCQRLLSF